MAFVNKEYRPHRLLIPVIALLAVVSTVVFFSMFSHNFNMTPDSAVAAAAFAAFVLVAIVGLVFKPLLGE